MIDTLLIGGKGNIGAGLRTYLPQINDVYQITSVDLPGSEDKATDPNAQRTFVDMDISADDDGLRELLKGRDLVVYLARKDPLGDMNAMTDQVFRAIMDVCPTALIVGSSSVHAMSAAYFPFDKPPYSTIAARRFDEIDPWPDPLPASHGPWPRNDYGIEKCHVETWCARLAVEGQDAIAARWGGINHLNGKKDEVAYFSVWCHQEDAARFVNACYESSITGKLRSGAHYYVISNNTYNIFDIETSRREIGYQPTHDAESFYG